MVLGEKKLTNEELDCLYRYYIDWMFNEKLAEITKYSKNWVLRLIVSDDMWDRLYPWIQDILFVESDNPCDSDQKFLKLCEKIKKANEFLVVFKGTEKVYSMLRYAYLMAPQKDASWIDMFLTIHDEMKNKLIV